jgi:hypothetical protein
LVTGIKFVRELCRPLREDGVIVEEEAPGEECAICALASSAFPVGLSPRQIATLWPRWRQ